ncbi:MAG TPA: cupin domain-containing protein [Solirubrobacteraceae bacterium]|nr:cupin domain-containing protein [Solirubrobacteraceae bacterium]
MSAVRSVHSADIPVAAGGTPDDPTVLRPVRHHLGVRAFGVNLFEAPGAGDEVIEPHVETQDSPSEHEELYLVLDGEARFEVDGETVDAPAGTFVLVPDPRSHRVAVARADGTRVLAMGAPRGAAFEVSAWERRRFGEDG